MEAVAPALPLPEATHRFEIDPGQDIVGVVQLIQSTQEDTFSDIARRFNVGYEEIVRANPGVDPWLPGERLIIVPTQFILPDAPREGLVINIPEMRLFYYPKPEGGKLQPGQKQVVYTYPIGIGKVGWATPVGVTKVARRAKDPTWRPPVSVIKEHRENGEELPSVVGPGPDNPLGNRAMYLGWPSYLIHGTNKPYGVGLRSSHGCLRLYPEDIEALYEIVPVGTSVRVVNQPFLFGWGPDGQLHLQAFDVLEDDPRDWKNAQKKLLTKSLASSIQKELKKRGEEVDWDVVSTFAHEPRGIPVPISVPNITIDQVLSAAITVQNRLPEGANWDGRSGLPDEQAVKDQLAAEEREPIPPAPEPAPQAMKSSSNAKAPVRKGT